MESYKLLKFLHVATVMVALGSTFAFPFLQAFAEHQGVPYTRFAQQFFARMEKMVIIPGAALLFVFGLGLYFNDQTGYNDDNPAWLGISMAWFVIAYLVGLFLQRKNVKEAIAALENVPDGAPLPEAYQQAAKKEQIVGGLLGLSIIGIAFLMVWKPGN